jgi:hypothetical protein
VPCQNSLIVADLGVSVCSLGCSAVFADQVTEDPPAFDPGGDTGSMAGLAQRRFLLPTLVRPVTVIVPGVLGQDLAQVPRAEDST